MSERGKPTRTSGEGRSQERIRDPRAGLDRMKEALRHIVKVPKSVVTSGEDDGTEGGPT